MKKYLLVCLLFATLKGFAVDIAGVYPTHWWVGMKNPKLQLLVHGNGVGGFTKFTSSNPAIKIEKINKIENSNYVFLDLFISAAAKPGTFKINMSGGGMGIDMGRTS